MSVGQYIKKAMTTLIIATFFTVLFSSCATMINGTSQSIYIKSDPLKSRYHLRLPQIS